VRRNYSYYILLPEDPSYTNTDNNPLLRMAAGGAMEYDTLTEANCEDGMARLCLDYELEVTELENKIKEDPDSVTFASVLGALDALDRPLQAGWAACKVMYAARSDVLPQHTYMTVHERCRQARATKFQSSTIYDACKHILASDKGLDEAQQRVIRKFLLEAKLNGIELKDREAERFARDSKMLNKDKLNFHEKLSLATRQFKHPIADDESNKALLEALPEELKDRMKRVDSEGNTSYIVSFRDDVYQPFLEYCPRRSLRFNAWQAYNTRCSNEAYVQNLNTNKDIKSIRKYRRDIAKQLGFESYAQMSMETKMAGKKENVYNMLTALMVKAVPKQQEEMESLNKFAKESGFFEPSLEACDIPYYSRLQREQLYGPSPRIPLPTALSALYKLSSNLYGIEFEEHSDAKGAWHPSVHSLTLHLPPSPSGPPRANLHLDLVGRAGKAGQEGWSVAGRSYSPGEEGGCPSASLVFSLPPSVDHGPPTMSLAQASSLFFEFGSALQHVLSTAPYQEVCGSANVEWDAVAVAGHLCANWLYVPEVLSSLTGQPANEVAPHIAAANHMAAHRLCKHLYISNLDLMLHDVDTFWRNIVNELHKRYLPYPLRKEDQHVCGMSALWAQGSIPAACYGGTWSRMVAADLTEAFTAGGPSSWPEQGQRYRDTCLAVGGAVHSAEVFRRFRGRDPDPEALLRLKGIVAQ